VQASHYTNLVVDLIKFYKSFIKVFSTSSTAAAFRLSECQRSIKHSDVCVIAVRADSCAAQIL
jgi:hypothetical protein